MAKAKVVTRRIKWNNPGNGKKITKYINTMCRKYPKIAKEVLKHGIGDLGSWFSTKRGKVSSVNRATCGCMVGTTALIAMKSDPKTCAVVLKNEDKKDAAELLYNFILAKQGKYDPDRFELDSPLLTCIRDAGIAAADEAEVPWGSGIYPSYFGLPNAQYNTFAKFRHQEVVDHIEFLFKKKLGMVRPLRRVAMKRTIRTKRYGSQLSR